MRFHFFLCMVVFFVGTVNAQTTLGSTKWYNPLDINDFMIGGQGWGGAQFSNGFSRLPDNAKNKVRSNVWNLSRHSAGIYIDFTTDAQSIQVRYQVAGRLYMYHMPATGVSGVDLYTFDQASNPVWCRSRYTFGDTVQFRYSNLEGLPTQENGFRRYRLYLPLYNSVDWMEIGLNEHARLEPVRSVGGAPIVVYGTSKTQGACVSRPGLAWTSLLQRSINRDVINLGFSDNGRMESDLIELIADIEASVYVVDCLGNMLNDRNFPDNIIEDRIRYAYKRLREHHHNTPILFTQHPGLSDEVYNAEERRRVGRVNSVLERVIQSLKEEGADHLYMLAKAELGICQECTVDGTHPTDQGMRNYAKGYERKIRMIFEELGDLSLLSDTE